VSLGTVFFSDNRAAERVRTELADEAAQLGLATPEDAFCTAHEDTFATVVRLEN
jgi:hypothetical protein